MNCINCGRQITSPRSVARGMGPLCWRRAKDDKATMDLFFDGPTHPVYEAPKMGFFKSLINKLFGGKYEQRSFSTGAGR